MTDFLIAAAEDLSTFFVVMLAVALGIASIVWHFHRSSSLLEQWASENGLRIIDREYRHLVRGPFFWTTGKGQSVYRVTVQDADGRVRRGWVRCGSWLAGLFSSRVEVRWDPEPAPSRGFPVITKRTDVEHDDEVA